MQKIYNKKHLRELARVFLSLKTEKQMEAFLKSLLTLEELNSIPRRLQIIRLLKKGLTQREIAKKLQVSITTVTHGSILIKSGEFKDIE